MYLESVLKGYRLLPVPENPQLRDSLADKSLAELTRLLSTYRKLHNSTDVDTVKRAIRAIEIEEYYKHQSAEYREFPQIHSLIIGVDIARELRREKISHRLKQRLDEGMVNEVKALLDSGISSEDLIYYGLEYKYLTLYVLGKLSFNEMFHQLEIAIHQFAKRQMTWFRGMERRGFTIHWLDACLPMEDKVEKSLICYTLKLNVMAVEPNRWGIIIIRKPEAVRLRSVGMRYVAIWKTVRWFLTTYSPKVLGRWNDSPVPWLIMVIEPL